MSLLEEIVLLIKGGWVSFLGGISVIQLWILSAFSFTFLYLWKIFLSLETKYYLQAPEPFYGMGNLDKSDICSRLSGSSSRHFINEDGNISFSCEEKIKDVVVGRATLHIGVIAGLSIYLFFQLLRDLYKEWLRIRALPPKRDTAASYQRGEETKSFNVMTREFAREVLEILDGNFTNDERVNFLMTKKQFMRGDHRYFITRPTVPRTYPAPVLEASKED